MGGRWGVNRTVGQIYALLFLSSDPLCADEIVDALGISRSNVSMGLKELETWRLVRRKHVPGDRRERFETPSDVWEILRILAEERRRREVDPTLSVLRDLLMEEPVSTAERHAQSRMRDMHEMIEMLTGWADDVQRLSDDDLKRLLSLGATVSKVLDATSRLRVLPGGGRGAKAAQPAADREE